jgi:ABC-type Mn2+/Zn2+ transport system ATPase subunit
MGHRFMCKEYCDRILCISRKIMCSHTCGKRFVHEELLSDDYRPEEDGHNQDDQQGIRENSSWSYRNITLA